MKVQEGGVQRTTHRTGDEGDRRYRTVRLQFKKFIDDEFPHISGADDRKTSVS